LRTLPVDGLADHVTVLDLIPGVGLELADAEGDFLLLLVDAQDDGFHFLADVKDIRGPGDALGPGEFGDVDEAFDPVLEFDERAVGDQVRDLALDVGADGEALLDLVQGFFWVCLRPSETRSFSLLISRTMTSSSWPTLSNSLGWPRRPQVISVI